MGYAGPQGIDVFKDSGILNTINVVVDNRVQVIRSKIGCYFAGTGYIDSGKSEVRKFFEATSSA